MYGSKFFFFSLLIFLLACNKEAEVIGDVEDQISSAKLTEGLAEFQWILFQQMVQTQFDDTNILISPVSIASTLYMALEGAGGSTKEQMLDVLGLSGEGKRSVLEAYDDFHDKLESSGVNLQSENAMFYDESRIAPHKEFIDKLEKGFEAEVMKLDFASAEALSQINQWVKEKTQEKIPKIMENIRQEEAMFLINALYYQADWLHPFPLENTRVDTFFSADGNELAVPFMFQDVSDFKSYADGTLQAVELPFADTNYVMTLIQPAKGKSLSDVLIDLTVDNLYDLLESNLRSGRIFMHMPKFEVTYEKELSSDLKALGMVLPFSTNQADFSDLGIASGNIFLTRVKHKTFLSIDEKGAEGAAVTSVGVGVTSLPPTFLFNRPFLYLIRHRNTGAFLFAGRMDNPTL